MNSSLFSFRFFSLFAGGFLLLFTLGFELAHRWKIKENYQVKFTHADAEGVFKAFEGEIFFDEARPDEATFHVKIAVNSVESGNPMRNESIRSGEWLDAEKYPEIHFQSKGAVRKENQWQTTGLLKLRGVEKSLTIPFQFRKDKDSAQFEGSFHLKLADYRLSTDPEEQIRIDLKVPVQK